MTISCRTSCSRRLAVAAHSAATAAGASATATRCSCPASGGGFPNRMAMDMAIFYDTGMVAPRLDAIALNSVCQRRRRRHPVPHAGIGRRCASISRKGPKACNIVFVGVGGVLIMATSRTTRRRVASTRTVLPVGRGAGAARGRRTPVLRRRSADPGARDAGCLGGQGVGRSTCSSIWRSTSSAARATRHSTCARETSIRLTRCRIRAGSPIAS